MNDNRVTGEQKGGEMNRGEGRKREFRFGQTETEMQKCMKGKSKLGLRVKLGIRVTYVYLRNQAYKDGS